MMPRNRNWLLGIFLVLISQPVAAEDALLLKIHQATSSITSLSADFISTKTVAFLEEPIITQGHIDYDRQQGIRWEVLKPFRMALVYNENGMTQFIGTHDHQWQKQTIDSDMVLMEVMKQLKTWLSGEAFAMHDMYDIHITSTQPVIAVFIPQHAAMRKVLSRLEFEFGQELSVVRTLKVIEGEGDVTTIQYQNIQINPQLKESLFQ